MEGLIAQRKQHLQQLDDLLKSVFLTMFGDVLNAESETTLRNYITLQQGFAFKSDTFLPRGLPIIKIGTINKGYFDYSTLSYVATESFTAFERYAIYAGDLLISMTGTVGKDDYGNTCFVPQSAKFSKYLLNQRVAKIVCDATKTNPYFIDFFLRTPEVKSRLVKNNRGVRQANLSANDIYSVKIAMPSLDVQIEFETVVRSVNSLRVQFEESLVEFDKLFSVLSQLAFSGELDLSRVVLPETNDEMDSAIDGLQQAEDKLEQDPIHDVAGNRRKAFYPFGNIQPDISVTATVQVADWDNPTPKEISVSLKSQNYPDETNTWAEIYRIPSRYAVRCCSNAGGTSWRNKVLDDCQNYGLNPDQMYKAELKTARNSPWHEANFLKIAFLEGCDRAGIFS